MTVEYSFKPTKESIKQTYKLSPKDKLDWLEQANNFINKKRKKQH